MAEIEGDIKVAGPAGESWADQESWDAFWAEAGFVQRHETICGVDVLVPTDMPLNLSARLHELEASESEEDLHELVGMLFGEGAMADWIDAGMTMRQFQTALAWGIAHANGQDISFREAFERVQEAEGQGKAVPANRAARRAAAKPRSAATGGPSKRTSSGSTASARKRSAS